MYTSYSPLGSSAMPDISVFITVTDPDNILYTHIQMHVRKYAQIQQKKKPFVY